MSAISYSVKSAAANTGVSEALISQAINAGELQERYWNSKKIIRHEDLKAFVDNLPTVKPEVSR